MFEYQDVARQIQAPARAPGAPSTPQAPIAPAIAGGPIDPLAPTPVGELQKLSYSALRARLSELKQQRSDLASRREALASGFENATGANQAGMGARLTTLDANIVMYEKEIAAVGRELAVKAGQRGITIDPGFNPPSNGNQGEDIAAAVFGTFFTTALVAVFIARRFVRRRLRGIPSPMQSGMLQSGERLDRIEQAVDSIAIEIERVSENQRFMTRLMTETQLGDTLKDVRKSTELAKSAASEG